MNNGKTGRTGGSWAAALAEARRQLEEAGVPEAATDAWLLLEHVSGRNRAWYFLHSEEEMPEDLRRQFADLTARRAQRIPLQHLTGTAWFMGFPFRVNECVLVPRPDTEKLVELVLEAQASGKLPCRGEMTAGADPRLLDLCTGSGCIAVSLVRLGHFSEVTASDISEEALAVAAENVRALCPGQVRLLRSDLFAALEGERFDVIVSNPPYIPSAEIPELMPEVRDHDPSLALDGGADGLEIYRRLAEECPRHLTEGGRIYWEIGWNQAEDVAALLKERGFAEISIVRDDAGMNRVAAAVWTGDGSRRE